MSERGATWVLCGGAARPGTPDDALRINIGPGDGHEIDVQIEGIEERLSGQLPDRLRDLVCIAAYVLAADCGVRRGTEATADDGLSWRRDFRFVIPVAEPEFWNSVPVRRLLSDTLGFLADETYRFHFVLGTGPAGRQLRFLAPDGRSFVPLADVEEVMLFSGGMDSFAGAVQACLVEKRQVLLVSHRSSDRLHAIQNQLVKDLRARAGQLPPRHVSVKVTKCSEALRVENTQRSRSLLFAALAAGVAWICGRRSIRFYENGIIALNIPISAQVLGAHGTRTVHPLAIERFGQLISTVLGEPFSVDNPFEEKTRSDVAALIRDGGAADLLRYTWSCARVRHAKKDGPFCGVCSQCVDRQFAVRAAGIAHEDPDSLYETRLFDDKLKKAVAVKMALGYLQTARAFRSTTTPASFLAQFGAVCDAAGPLARTWGCSKDEALRRLQALHRRQGEMVAEVLGQALKDRAFELGDGPHPSSMLGLYLGEGLKKGRQLHGVENDPDEAAAPAPTIEAAPAPVAFGQVLSRDTFVLKEEGWIAGEAGGHWFVLKDSAGMRLISLLLRHPGRAFDVLELSALANGEDPKVVRPGSLPTTDRSAIASARDAIEKLAADEQDLRDAYMPDLADEKRAEREAIEEQLVRDLKLGGAPRDVPPELERARSKVSRAIDRTLESIGSKPTRIALKVRLANAIHKGFSVRYEPRKGEEGWITEA